jgi:phosphohistidine phosphatase
MRLYLVQHAEAMSEEQNPDRPLTDLGRQQTAWVANVAGKLGVEIDEIRHSGKTRARETAEIIAEALGPSQGVTAVSGLSPLDDVEPVAQEVEGASGTWMLVGHLPFMERMAGYLLTGDAHQPVIDFTNAGIVCLEKMEERWQAAWILTPQIAEIET